MSVGEEIEKSWISDDSCLTDLIAAYNKRQAAAGLVQIDEDIPDLRNAMAHGIIIAGDQSSPAATCIKFARPENRSSVTTVEAKFVMTFEWIAEQTRRLYITGVAVNSRLRELVDSK